MSMRAVPLEDKGTRRMAQSHCSDLRSEWGGQRYWASLAMTEAKPAGAVGKIRTRMGKLLIAAKALSRMGNRLKS